MSPAHLLHVPLHHRPVSHARTHHLQQGMGYLVGVSGTEVHVHVRDTRKLRVMISDKTCQHITSWEGHITVKGARSAEGVGDGVEG